MSNSDLLDRLLEAAAPKWEMMDRLNEAEQRGRISSQPQPREPVPTLPTPPEATPHQGENMTGSANMTLVAGTVSVTLLCAVVAFVTSQSGTMTPPASGEPVCIAGPRLTIMTVSSPLEATARTALLAVPNVDGAYLQEHVEGDETVTINVLAREHGIVERDSLFRIEDELEAEFGVRFTLIVWAHQGRDMRDMAGPNLLFARG